MGSPKQRGGSPEVPRSEREQLGLLDEVLVPSRGGVKCQRQNGRPIRFLETSGRIWIWLMEWAKCPSSVLQGFLEKQNSGYLDGCEKRAGRRTRGCLFRTGF